MYAEGSYFGDSDVLADKFNEGRDGTAIVEEKSRLLVICSKDLKYVLRKYKHTYMHEMTTIAFERRHHHKKAIKELKL